MQYFNNVSNFLLSTYFHLNNYFSAYENIIYNLLGLFISSYVIPSFIIPYLMFFGDVVWCMIFLYTVGFCELFRDPNHNKKYVEKYRNKLSFVDNCLTKVVNKLHPFVDGILLYVIYLALGGSHFVWILAVSLVGISVLDIELEKQVSENIIKSHPEEDKIIDQIIEESKKIN